jgi:coenzyme F420 hydrogenase subunit beta
MSAEGLDSFVPLMKVSKGFDELKRLVIDEGICSGCSTCYGFCDRIDRDEDGNAMAAEGRECNMDMGAIQCSFDGTCVDICPMVGHSKAELDEQVFGAAREDVQLGHYKKIVAVRAKKKEILESAQDGGAATAFLAAGLESGIIGGAVYADRDEKWKTKAAIATKPEELYGSGGGTKYARTPTTMKWAQTIRDIKNLGMVGTGCQTHGARKAMQGLLSTLIEKTKESDTPVDLTLIGLFCFENFPYKCAANAIEEKFGVKMEDIIKTDITKGKFIITKKDGSEDKKPVKDFHECVPASCMLCTNFTAEYADLSCGSVGSDAGWSTVIVRSDKGEALLAKAEELGYVEVSDKIALEFVTKGQELKVKMRSGASKKREEEGKYIPEYGYD